MSTLLITGGSGFVGKSLLEAFGRGRLRGHGIARVVALARHASALQHDAPELLGPGVELVDADVRDLDDLFGAELIVHAAASADAARYRDDADADGEASTIIDGTRRVAALASKPGHDRRVLFVSSGAVYGRHPPSPSGIGEHARFSDAVDPAKLAYTCAKRAAEDLVRVAARNHALSASIARCFAFVGPWLPLDRHFAAGGFLRSALSGGTIVVTARHPVIRSYLHADDLVAWIMRIGLAGNPGCPVFNVGSDQAITIRDLASLVGRIAAVPVEFPPEDPDMDASQIDCYVPDIHSARRELGLSVSIPIEEAFMRTLESLRDRRTSGASVPGRG